MAGDNFLYFIEQTDVILGVQSDFHALINTKLLGDYGAK